MTVKTQGFYWHVHHGKLIEWCYDYEGRERYIQRDKPEYEQEIRLRLFQPVKGTLPNELIEARQAYVEARQVFDRARQVYDEARQARAKTPWLICVKADQARAKAWQVYDEARQVYDRARRALDNKALLNNMSVMEELHGVECIDCPWDGHTIFPNTQQ